MANPFATFRKNQKAWMAGTVLLALMAFVVAPAIQQISDAGSGGATGAEVVRWDGGSVNEGDLIALQRRHNLVSRFLTRLADEVMAAGGTPGVPNFVPNPSGGYFSLGINPSSEPRQICQMLMINDYAEDLGITVDEEAAKAFLRLYCDRRIDDAKLQSILRESTSGQLSGFELTDTIRKHLVATIATRVAQTGISTNSPGQDFNSFRKVTETAKVEVFPVRIDDFIDKVTGEPSEAELKEIYEAGSLRVANPSLPEPGFLKTYQADFEYVYGDTALWQDREKAKLTEEALKAEYDRLVEMGQLMTPVESDAKEADAGSEETAAPETASPESEASDTGSEAAPAGENAEGDSAGKEQADGDKASEEGQTESAESPTEEAAEPAKEKAEPAKEDAKEETTGGGSGDQSRLQSNAVRFVSFQEETTEAGAGTENATSQQSGSEEPPVNTLREEAKAEENSGQEAEENAESPPQESTTEPQENAGSDANTAPDAGTTPEAGEADQTAEEQPPAETPATTGDETPAQPQMRVKTFEEAREEIADSLASQAAQTGISLAMTTLREEHINPYYDEFRQYVALRDAEDIPDEDRPAEPPALNLKQIAESLGLSYGKTGMVTATSLFELPFGQSLVSAGQQSVPVAQGVMNAQIGIYQPMSSFYFDQTGQMGLRQYQFWKTDEKLAYVPEFEDVRDEVLEAWKVQQARGLTEDAAKSIASKVTAGENAWASAIKDTEQALLIQTNPFTWYTRGANGVSATVVRELDSTGEAFMRSVFSASEGEAVVAPNQPLRVYYVARVQEFSPDTDTLLERFGAQPNNASVQQITGAELNQAYSDWYQGLEAELGVQWLQAL